MLREALHEIGMVFYKINITLFSSKTNGRSYSFDLQYYGLGQFAIAFH